MIIAAALGSAPNLAVAEPLRLRLHALATQYNFQLEGAELIGNERLVVKNFNNLDDQIGRFLENYNYIVMRNPEGRIKRLTIVGAKSVPAAPVSAVKSVRVERKGAEHYVEAILTGPNGYSVTLTTMVDTGASTIVLPRSMARTLGFRDASLQRVLMQTANGTTDGLLATLRSVRVGDVESKEVLVTFVDDRQLGGKRLLGMSFLGRFRLTIDGGSGTISFADHE